MESPLRIALLDSWKRSAFDGSGTAVGISNLAESLRGLGHDVERIRPSEGAARIGSRLAFNLRLPRRLRSRPPHDLVVGFDLDGFRWASAAYRPSPYVVCLKGVSADEARFSQSMRERLELTLLAWLERGNARGADRVIVPSRYSHHIARSCYGVPGSALRIVPEAVDLRPWKKLRAGAAPARAAPRSELTILSVARQYPRKDTATLIRALPIVRRPHPNVRLVLIGDGPELPRLKALTKRYGLDGVVRFRGAVERDDDVRAAFFDADVFCLPSIQEGFGIVFVEAMAAGLPIVAARSAAVPELVSDEETGILVTPGSARALAHALIALLDDPRKRARLGAEGIQRSSTYDLDAVGRSFLAATLPSKRRQA